MKLKSTTLLLLASLLVVRAIDQGDPSQDEDHIEVPVNPDPQMSQDRISPVSRLEYVHNMITKLSDDFPARLGVLGDAARERTTVIRAKVKKLRSLEQVHLNLAESKKGIDDEFANEAHGVANRARVTIENFRRRFPHAVKDALDDSGLDDLDLDEYE